MFASGKMLNMTYKRLKCSKNSNELICIRLVEGIGGGGLLMHVYIYI